MMWHCVHQDLNVPATCPPSSYNIPPFQPYHRRGTQNLRQLMKAVYIIWSEVTDVCVTFVFMSFSSYSFQVTVPAHTLHALFWRLLPPPRPAAEPHIWSDKKIHNNGDSKSGNETNILSEKTYLEGNKISLVCDGSKGLVRHSLTVVVSP